MEGTLLSGNEPTEQPIKWEDVSAAKMQDKATYEALGWDMSKVWDWSSSGKQPVLRGYDAPSSPQWITPSAARASSPAR